MDFLQTLFMTLYTFVLVIVSIYGFHRWALVFLYYRHRRRQTDPKGRFDELPCVTVQLPMYNEKYVAKRIIEKACQIDYPPEKLQIQVLDDSTDETAQIASAAAAKARGNGFNVEYIHRDNRIGFKSGAMENGLKTATGEFITIFDADFIPPTNALTRSIHYFTDPKVGVVQTRWEHLNRTDSMLTRTQAIFLDGHFVIEHVARNRSGRFMSFNGTAGTWRRQAIADAGGWQHDTLTEDMDLSYRAQLRGWKFVFLPQLTAPAELPSNIAAFKAQQHRWTKGGTQTALKLLPRIWLSKAPLKVKVEATFHLTGFAVHLLMVILVLMLFPAMHMRSLPWEAGTTWRTLFDLGIFSLATLSVSTFYVCSQFELFGTWRETLKFLPFVMALGVGVCISNAKAVLEAIFRRQSEFVRTPKFGAGVTDYNEHRCKDPLSKRKIDTVPYIEFAFGLYMATCAVLSATAFKSALVAPFLVIFAFGFLYVSVLSFQERFARTRMSHKPAGANEAVVEDVSVK
ncbi:MAG: glycosyltransferase [Planctomycetes bacterium]|nr:glycosyltransferase [Planctomycetota bacterium]